LNQRSSPCCRALDRRPVRRSTADRFASAPQSRRHAHHAVTARPWPPPRTPEPSQSAKSSEIPSHGTEATKDSARLERPPIAGCPCSFIAWFTGSRRRLKESPSKPVNVARMSREAQAATIRKAHFLPLDDFPSFARYHRSPSSRPVGVGRAPRSCRSGHSC
jgi:hypothetical protein